MSGAIGAGCRYQQPGLYEWRIEGVGCYIGQHESPKRPRRHYGRNVARLIDGLPYRKGKPDGYRPIHIALRAAVKAGCLITLTILENEPTKAGRNRRERELVAERRAELGASGVEPIMASAFGSIAPHPRRGDHLALFLADSSHASTVAADDAGDHRGQAGALRLHGR